MSSKNLNNINIVNDCVVSLLKEMKEEILSLSDETIINKVRLKKAITDTLCKITFLLSQLEKLQQVMSDSSSKLEDEEKLILDEFYERLYTKK